MCSRCGCLWSFATLDIHHIGVAEEDDDVSEMDHATKEVETPSIRIPLELNEILEPF